MHSEALEQFVQAGDQVPSWFNTGPHPPNSPWQWLQPDLNTGIINTFNFPEGASNCTDPRAVFRTDPFQPFSMKHDPFEYQPQVNFWSCAFYPNLSRDVRETRLPAENVSFLLDHQMNATVAAAAGVASFLSTCLVAYCDNTARCKTRMCTMSHLRLNESLLSAAAIDDCLNNICDNNPENLSNPDIAGVGVVYSFYIQFAIACLATIVLAFCIFASRQVPIKDSPNSPPVLVTTLPRVQKTMEIVLITLNNFQQAQCCFAIAIDIASMITLRTYTTELTRRDRFAMLFASTAGITPTTMVLVGLMASKENHSALTFWLTFATWILSLTVVFHPEMLRGVQSTGSLGGDASLFPKACGRISPAVLCGIQPSVAGLTYMILASTVGIPLLLIWYLWPSTVRLIHRFVPRTKGRLAATPYLDPSDLESHTPPLRPPLRKITKFMLFVIYAGTFVSAGFFIANVAVDSTYQDVKKEWTFGQIVAIIVWLPSLLAFLNDTVYGPVRGRGDQFPDTMKIVRVSFARGSEVHPAPEPGNVNPRIWAPAV